MHLHQLSHQRQADTAALVAPPPRILYAAESIKYAGKVRSGDSGSRYPSPEVLRLRRGAQVDTNLSVEGRLQSIGEKIENHLLPHLRVYIDRFRQGLAFHDQLSPARSTAARKTLASSIVNKERSVA